MKQNSMLASFPVINRELPEMTAGKKFDGGKAPVWQGLIQYFPRAMRAIAEISRYGKEKYNLDYSDVNWSRVEGGWQRYSDALARHVLGEIIDGPIDPESGKHHDEMALWNAAARVEIRLRKEEEEQKKNNERREETNTSGVV